jgi:pimeloyl-[acyl-carrier protein] methyl ester esterase
MTLHSEVSGSGPDLVLLHGWGAGADVWKELILALGQRFRVHAVDLPGYGGSPACEPYTLRAVAEELAACLPAGCLVCAWSLGGQVALAWASAAPQQVARLALIAVNPCFARRPDWRHAMDAVELRAFARSLETDRTAALRRFALLQARGDRLERQVTRRLREALSAQVEPDGGALGQGLRILMDDDLRPLLPSVKQPVLIVQGLQDGLVPSAAAEYLCASLPSARLVVMEGAAHAPFLSSPQETCALLAEFFDER